MAISLSGWIERWVAQPEKASSPEPLMSSHNLHELTLRIAACEHVSDDLSAVLGWVQAHLTPGYTAASETGLCLALSVSPAQLTLIMPPGVTLDQEQASAVDYLLSAEYVETEQWLQLPSWPQPMYARRLLPQGENSAAWLLLPGRWGHEPLAQTIEPLRRALSDGLRICLAHQRQREAAIEKERREYAAELHDTIAQELGFLRLRTSRLEKACRQPMPELKALATDIHLQTQRAYRQTRELISSARVTLEDSSLNLELMRSVEEFEQRSGLVFELDNRAQPGHLSKRVAIQVLLIVREALSNSVRHAHATHVRIQLLPRHPGGLLVRVDDNGSGIVQGNDSKASFGLDIMRERALRIDAHLKVGPLASGGTRVELTLAGLTTDSVKIER